MTDSMTHSSDALMISLENVNKWYGQFHVRTWNCPYHLFTFSSEIINASEECVIESVM